jgi:hypothetical protein
LDKNLAETQYWTKTLQRLNTGQKPSRDSILDKNLADSILDKNLPETQYWTKTFQRLNIGQKPCRLNIGQKPSRNSILDKNLPETQYWTKTFQRLNIGQKLVSEIYYSHHNQHFDCSCLDYKLSPLYYQLAPEINTNILYFYDINYL